MADQELTTTEVAERLKAADVTVRLWCRQGRFPNARLVEHPRGDYWVIPESEVKKFEPPLIGRPRGKQSATKGNGMKKAAKKGRK